MAVPIPLYRRNGQVCAYALVDIEDVPLVLRYKWHQSSMGYAARQHSYQGRYRMMLLHRLLLGLDYGNKLQGDHINRVRLDNRRSNLRIVTAAQQAQNASVRKDSRAFARGVQQDGKVWRARVFKDGRRVNIGSFGTKEEAAEAAKKFRAEALPFSTV